MKPNEFVGGSQFLGDSIVRESLHGFSFTNLTCIYGFCLGVRVHQGITIAPSLFRSHSGLAVVYCLVLCSGSCEPVHEDRTHIRAYTDFI